MWHNISIGVGTGGQGGGALAPNMERYCIIFVYLLLLIIRFSLQPPNQRELPTSMISTCLIILHNSPAMCYRICRPILYPPNHSMFYSCNYIIHWLTNH